MKLRSTLTLFVALAGASLAHAQSTMNHGAMAGMQHGDMAATPAASASSAAPAAGAVHRAPAVVRALDPAKSSATLAHEAVPEMHLPAMTMAFVVKDKTLFSKLAVGKRVNIEFVQQGADFVLTAVK